MLLDQVDALLGGLLTLLIVSDDLFLVAEDAVADKVLVLGLLPLVVAVQELLSLLANHRLPIFDYKLHIAMHRRQLF